MSSEKQLRMVVLSASGSGRKRTIPALEKQKFVSIAAIHGRNVDKLKAIATEYHIEHFYTDVDELLSNEKFDFAFVASPPFLHKAQILKLAAAGKSILCEKPLCITLEDAMAITQAVKGNNILFRLAHHVRHQKAMRDIKDLIVGGAIGEIRSAFLQWSFNLNRDAPSAAWKLDPKLGGRHSFFDAGVHGIDLALHLFGNPRRVVASGVSTFAGDTLDSSVAVFEYPMFNVVLAASQNQAPVGNDLRIYGTEGSICAPGALNEASIARIEIQTKQQFDVREYPPENLYRSEIEDFARMIAGAGSYENTGTTIDDAVLAVRTLTSITESIERGCWVAI